jgi:hypothetical protein
MDNFLKPLDNNIKELMASGYALCHIFPSNLCDFSEQLPLHSQWKKHSSDDQNIFLNAPCSQVKSGLPMRLYDYNGVSPVGFLFDARDAHISYTAPNVIYTGHPLSYVYMGSIFPETDKIQESLDDNSPEKRNKMCLHALQRSWELIEKDVKGYYERTLELDHRVPLVTETNAKIKSLKDIKAVIYYSNTINLSPDEGWDDPFKAIVTKGFLEREFGHKVPLIFYENISPYGMKMSPSLEDDRGNLKLPKIAEMNLNEIVVAEAIKLREPQLRDRDFYGDQKEIKGLIKNSAIALGIKPEHLENLVKNTPTTEIISSNVNNGQQIVRS